MTRSTARHSGRLLSYGFTLLVFIAALVPRVYALGSFLTIDELKWAEGAAQFLLALQAGDLFQTYWHFFPGITISWGSALILGGLCLPAADLASCAQAQVADLATSIGWLRLSPVLWSSVGIAGLYWLVQRLVGARLALFTALLLAVDPFFTGHSRILNGDASAAILMFLSLLAFLLYWWGEGQPGSGSTSSTTPASPLQPTLLLSGVLAGLAGLTKLPAPLIGLFVGGLGLVAIGVTWRRAGVLAALRRWLVVLGVWGGVAGLTFFLLWPAMWVAPLETVRLLYVDAFTVGEVGTGHDTFFLGRTVTDPGFWFYPYTLAFRLTPVVMAGLVMAGAWLLLPVVYTFLRIVHYFLDGVPFEPAVTIARVIRHAYGFTLTASRLLFPPARATRVALVMLAYVIFVILVANLSPKKLDRYVMAVIPAVILLAAIGLESLLRAGEELLSKATGIGIQIRRAGLAVVVLEIVLIGLHGLFAVPVAPYYLTYYNPLLGGVGRAVNTIPVGWGEGLEQAAYYLNRLPQAESLAVSSWYSDIFNPYFIGQRQSFSDDGRAQLAADYVVFYVNQIQRQKPYSGLVDYFRDREPEFVVAVDSAGRAVNLTGDQDLGERVPWVEIYRAPAAQSAGGAPKIEGVAQLLAYKIAGSEEAGQPESSQTLETAQILRQDEIPVTLFLRVLGPWPEQSRFKVALAQNPDPQQARWGQWTPTERSGDWIEGHVVAWQGHLRLPPEMPPGRYRLWVGLGRGEDQVAAEFDISEKDPFITLQ